MLPLCKKVRGKIGIFLYLFLKKKHREDKLGITENINWDR